jgi:hypothetical protein
MEGTDVTRDIIVAPAGTPPGVIAKLNAAFVAVLNDPAVVERIHALGRGKAEGGGIKCLIQHNGLNWSWSVPIVDTMSFGRLIDCAARRQSSVRTAARCSRYQNRKWVRTLDSRRRRQSISRKVDTGFPKGNATNIEHHREIFREPRGMAPPGGSWYHKPSKCRRRSADA